MSESLEFDEWFERRHGKMSIDRFSNEYAEQSYIRHETLKAWNEQQKKIDAVLKLIESSEKYSDRSIHGLQDEIKDLLK